MYFEQNHNEARHYTLNKAIIESDYKVDFLNLFIPENNFPTSATNYTSINYPELFAEDDIFKYS